MVNDTTLCSIRCLTDYVIDRKIETLFDEALTVDSEIELIVQINGKLRASFKAAKDISKDDALANAKELENIKKYIGGKDIVKEIFVPGRLVNLVVKE